MKTLHYLFLLVFLLWIAEIFSSCSDRNTEVKEFQKQIIIPASKYVSCYAFA
jgi:hypothetical protein